MANASRQKGYRTVASGKRIFEAKGYISGNLERNSKFSKQRDLFNLWDYLFVKGKEHIFVQFKTNKKGQKWKEPYMEFGNKHGSKYVKYQIWNKFDRKGFKIIECKK